MRRWYVPRRIELDKDILAVIKDNLVKLLANQYEYVLVLSRWDRFALQLGHQFTIQVVGNHGRDCGRFNILALVIWILQLLVQVLDDEAWPFGFGEVQSLGVVPKFGGIDPDEVNLATIFGSYGFECINVGLALLLAGVDKEVRQWPPAVDIDTIGITIDLAKDRNSQLFQPVLEFFSLGRGYGVGVFCCRCVEGAVYNNSWSRDASSFDRLWVRGDTEEVLITVFLSHSGELGCRCFRSRGNVCNNNHFIRVLEFDEVSRSDFRDSRKRLPGGEISIA